MCWATASSAGPCPARPMVGTGSVSSPSPHRRQCLGGVRARGSGFPDLGRLLLENGRGAERAGPLGVYKTVLKTDKFTLEADSNPALPMLTIEIMLGGAVGSASIKADATGLTLSCAGNTIAMGPTGVAINKTNLVVMK